MSPIRTARPYAAKAIIEHSFDTDHLDIWVTFRFPMDITQKPANAKWICRVDTVIKAVTVSAWQDFWTMLLTVPAIASIPDVVTLEYDGPDSLLTTTWNKQWEPWGPILSSDSALLPYGEFSGFEINWTQAAAINTWYPILDTDHVSTSTNKIVYQNNGELKITVAGIYVISWFFTLECTIAGKHVLAGISKSSGRINIGLTHNHFGRANEEVALAGSAIIPLLVDDTVGLGVETSDAGNPTLTVDHDGFNIHEIGST